MFKKSFVIRSNRIHFGICSVATAIGFFTPLCAQSIVVATAEADKVSLSDGDSLEVTSTGSLDTAADKAVSIKSPSVSILVDSGGSITSQDDGINAKDFTSGTGTFKIINNGTITSTDSGQAIDLNGVSSSAATTMITNNVSGQIIADNADGIRPGANATVVNYGTIYADGPAGESHDSVDFQSYAGTVVNEDAGLISGQRHGITSDTNVDVTNYGTIIGRNGSGVGSDGTGWVVNYGTIIGTYDGSGTGDGDGVDIDGAFYVDNYGTIEGLGAAGVDKGGGLNESEGVALTGGGTLVNEKSGVISSVANGVTICCSTNNSLFENYGQISGVVGFRQSGVVQTENYGEIYGSSYAVWVGNGVGSQIDNFGSITGDTYGVYVTEEHDKLVIDNIGAIHGGSAAILIDTGASAKLILEGGSIIDGAIENYGSMDLSNSVKYLLTSPISGSGQLTKSGAGNLFLTGNSSFSGNSTINSGTLSIDGSLAQSVVTIKNAATLGGTGRIGGIVAESGAIVAPGDNGGVGKLSVSGNVTFQSGSIYQVAVTASRQNSGLDATGTAILQGGTVNVLAGSGNYALSTRYTILTAAAGTNGEFENVVSNFAFLTPSLSYDANHIYLTLTRNDISLSSIGTTSNQRAVGLALETLTPSNPVVTAVVQMDAETARSSFDQLSGEIHASVRTGMFDDSRLPREAVLERLSQRDGVEGSSVWMQGVGDWGSDDANASRLSRSAWGMLGGVDTGLGKAVLGIAGGYIDTRLTNALSSRADIKSIHVLGYAGVALGNVNLRGGVGYAHDNIDTRRTVSFAGLSNGLDASYDGSTLQAFGEIGYRLVLSGGSLEPFAGIATIRARTASAAEKGGAAALKIDAATDFFTTSTLGLKAVTASSGPLFADGTLGWQYRFGSRAPVSTMRFADSGSFVVDGTPISREAATFSLGAGWRVGARATITARYSGMIGGTSDASTAKLSLNVPL